MQLKKDFDPIVAKVKIADPFQLLFTTNFLSDAKRYHTFYATIQNIRKLYIALCDSASTNLDEVWGWKKVVKNLECVIGDPFQLLFTSNFIRRETLPYFVRNNTTYPQTLYSAMWFGLYRPPWGLRLKKSCQEPEMRHFLKWNFMKWWTGFEFWKDKLLRKFKLSSSNSKIFLLGMRIIDISPA